jgi:hypothetical protein
MLNMEIHLRLSNLASDNSNWRLQKSANISLLFIDTWKSKMSAPEKDLPPKWGSMSEEAQDKTPVAPSFQVHYKEDLKA